MLPTRKLKGVKESSVGPKSEYEARHPECSVANNKPVPVKTELILKVTQCSGMELNRVVRE